MMNWMENMFNYKDYVSMIVCINFSVSLFIYGFLGVLYNCQNILKLLICFELVFFSVVLQFIFISTFTNNMVGQLYALCIMTMVGSESAMACSLLILVFRMKNQVSILVLSSLKG